MTTKYVGQRIKRNEDPRLLTGQALFVDDVQIPGMFHAAFLRSDYAHARLLEHRCVEGAPAAGRGRGLHRRRHGRLLEAGPAAGARAPSIPGLIFNKRTQVPMVKDKVRHAGEALACVIAESRYIAEDAFADIVVDLEPLEAVADLEAALEPGAPLVHESWARIWPLMSNRRRATTRPRVPGPTWSRAAGSIIDRGAAAALENRGYVSGWDAKTPGADHLGYHPGADRDSQHHRRRCWACRRARCG